MQMITLRCTWQPGGLSQDELLRVLLCVADAQDQ